MEYATGECYVGQWKNDVREGFGMCRYPNGLR